MADREKVNKALDEIAEHFHECWMNASFWNKAEKHFWELQNAARAAQEMLKEQEPERVEIVDSDGGRTHWYVCGGCKTPINPGDRFCHECGRAVKWDG